MKKLKLGDLSSEEILSREELGNVFVSSFSGSGSGSGGGDCSTTCYCSGGRTVNISIGDCAPPAVCDVVSNTWVACKEPDGGGTVLTCTSACFES